MIYCHIITELGITKEEALSILKVIKGEAIECGDSTSATGTGPITVKPWSVQSKSVSALEILRDELNFQNIITFCEKLDTILGGGVPVNKITEFCGAPGVGKTQMW